MKTKEEYVTIKQLFHQGYNISQIARTLKINRKTVKKYLNCDVYPGYRNQNRKSQLKPHRDYLEARLKEYPLLSSIRLYEELKERGYNGGYRMLCKFVRTIRLPKQPRAYIRVETPPGKQGQADWAEFAQVKLGEQMVDLHCFIITLSYSRNLYIEFCADEKEQALQNCHIHAFEYFEGVPLEIRYDNISTIVIRRENGKPVFHQGFKDFATFYNFKPNICLPYHKEGKGKAERKIRYVRENFFYGRTFKDLTDLNTQAWLWLDNTANQRYNRLYQAKICELLKEEHLQALPSIRYDTRIPHLHKVNKDCLISYKANFYSVPHIYAGQTIEVQDDGRDIFCLYHGKLIAQHTKCLLKKGQMIINPMHYEGLRHHSRYVELITQGEFILAAQALPIAQEEFDHLLAKYPGYFEEVQKRELEVYERLAHG